MDKGTKYFPNMDKGLGVNVDDYFVVNWDKEDSENTDNEISIPARCSFPPSFTARLHLPPIPGGPKEFLTRSVTALPFRVVTTCRPRPVPRYLLHPVFSRPGVSTSLCLPLSTSLPLPPSHANLYRRPSPLLVLIGDDVFFFPYPLSFRLALLRFRSISLCLLKFDSCSGVLLSKYQRLGCLHSLAIACPSTRPHDTWTFWRRSC